MLVVPPCEVGEASINTELDEVDRLRPIAAYNNARVFLATFDFYRETKYGDYLAKQAYYNVLEVQLDRFLPHIVFDSKRAKKRQFRNLYLRTQRLSVQGSFDEVFDTYVPQTYAIDSLSFVTPDVMEALMAASSYDIEVINDKLLLYAPLLDIKELEELAAIGRELGKQLNDNIDTYRDDRLEGEARKKSVTLFARSLLRSPQKFIIIATLSAAIIVFLFLWAFTGKPEYRGGILWNQISILIYIVCIGNCWEAGKIMRTNHKALESYRILYKTNRGKPIKSSIV